jgi:uncharacterized membrane protein
MNAPDEWAAVWLTVGVLLDYEFVLVVVQQRDPSRLARAAHAALREDWFNAISDRQGTEVLAVQTLRNSLMSATMTASTAVLGLMGTVTLAAPSLNAGFGTVTPGLPHLTPRLVLELTLLAVLFASLVCSVMTIRYYNHADFVGAIPVHSPERQRWSPAGVRYVRKAGVLYSWGLRHLMLVVPVVACLLYPVAGPVASVLLVVVLWRFDRFQSAVDGSAGDSSSS